MTLPHTPVQIVGAMMRGEGRATPVDEFGYGWDLRNLETGARFHTATLAVLASALAITADYSGGYPALAPVEFPGWSHPEAPPPVFLSALPCRWPLALTRQITDALRWAKDERVPPLIVPQATRAVPPLASILLEVMRPEAYIQSGVAVTPPAWFRMKDVEPRHIRAFDFFGRERLVLERFRAVIADGPVDLLPPTLPPKPVPVEEPYRPLGPIERAPKRR